MLQPDQAAADSSTLAAATEKLHVMSPQSGAGMSPPPSAPDANGNAFGDEGASSSLTTMHTKTSRPWQGTRDTCERSRIARSNLQAYDI